MGFLVGGGDRNFAARDVYVCKSFEIFAFVGILGEAAGVGVGVPFKWVW